MQTPMTRLSLPQESVKCTAPSCFFMMSVIVSAKPIVYLGNGERDGRDGQDGREGQESSEKGERWSEKE